MIFHLIQNKLSMIINLLIKNGNQKGISIIILIQISEFLDHLKIKIIKVIILYLGKK